LANTFSGELQMRMIGPTPYKEVGTIGPIQVAEHPQNI